MISDIQFLPHFPELLLISYTKTPSALNEPTEFVLLWNTHTPSHPEYTFNAGIDVLSARFSPFHPNLIIGGCYSGQIYLWDTRSSGRTDTPVQKTPMSDYHLGHTHPIYDISVIGTPNAHNILTTSTNGVVCSWSVDMLAQPQEYLGLSRFYQSCVCVTPLYVAVAVCDFFVLYGPLWSDSSFSEYA
jgi:dynein intermediate chain